MPNSPALLVSCARESMNISGPFSSLAGSAQGLLCGSIVVLVGQGRQCLLSSRRAGTGPAQKVPGPKIAPDIFTLLLAQDTRAFRGRSNRRSWPQGVVTKWQTPLGVITAEMRRSRLG
jgi:hypothetical protein